MFDEVLDVVIVVVVALLGLAAGFALGKMRGQASVRMAKASEVDALRGSCEAMKDDNARLAAQVAQAKAQSEGLLQQLSFAKSQLAQAQQAEQVRVQRERERAEADGLRRREEQEKALTEQGKVLSALDELQQKVSNIEEGRKHEMGVLGEQLKGLGEQQARLDRETSSLSAALRNNKVRGAWGEAQLRNIVESAGLLEHVDFDTQVVMTGVDGKTLRPDMIVHLPGGKTIPIDAKVPYADYQRACMIPETAGPEDREHVRALGDKAYWSACDTAPDFVIAFIPNEALLQAAMEADPTLMDDAFARKVALTSPVTLWAVLKSVAYAWQQQSLTDDAKTLFDLSRELYERFAVLGERANKLGTALTRTVTAYNQFASSLESRVLVTARKLQKLDQATVIGSVNIIDPDKSDVREITAPETTSE